MLKHDCKAHSEGKSKYFSFESPVRTCGLEAYNSITLLVQENSSGNFLSNFLLFLKRLLSAIKCRHF